MVKTARKIKGWRLSKNNKGVYKVKGAVKSRRKTYKTKALAKKALRRK